MRFFDFLGKAVCHQAVERSYTAEGKALLVCARCQGFYLSFVFSILFLWLRKKSYQPKKDFFFALVFLLPLVFDGSLSYLGFWQTSNNLRFTTGILAGFSFALLLMPLFSEKPKTKLNFFSYLFERMKVFSLVFVFTFIFRLYGRYLFESLLTSAGIFLLFFLINLAWLDWLSKGKMKNLQLYIFSVILVTVELVILNYLHLFEFF